MQIRVVVHNDSGVNGLSLTPFWIGLHDEDFDLFEVGEEASPGLEQIAEDGLFSEIATEFEADAPDGQASVVGEALPALSPFFVSEAIFDVDPGTQGQLTYAAMILPSNDAFIGSPDAVELFDEDGNFLGEQNIEISGEDVYDAGTEFNTELDAAFLNQTEPDTGVPGNGVIAAHPGFNGSAGNPVSEGQNILGGTNALGGFIDPVAADFTLPDYEVATVHINEFVEFEGSRRDDFYVGSEVDDLVQGRGGHDILIGGDGWDTLEGGNGNDVLIGGDGLDFLIGGRGNDTIIGGDGDDNIFGGRGRDKLWGGAGEDAFSFEDPFGFDRIMDFESGEDVIMALTGAFQSFEDVVEAATDRAMGVVIDFGDAGRLQVMGETIGSLAADDFIFL